MIHEIVYEWGLPVRRRQEVDEAWDVEVHSNQSKQMKLMMYYAKNSISFSAQNVVDRLEWLANDGIVRVTMVCACVWRKGHSARWWNDALKLLSSSKMDQMVKRLAANVYAQHRLAPTGPANVHFNEHFSLFHCFYYSFHFLRLHSHNGPPSTQFDANNKSANELPNKILRCIIFIIHFRQMCLCVQLIVHYCYYYWRSCSFSLTPTIISLCSRSKRMKQHISLIAIAKLFAFSESILRSIDSASEPTRKFRPVTLVFMDRR